MGSFDDARNVRNHEGTKVGEADHAEGLRRVVWDRFRPDCVVAVDTGDDTEVPLLRERDGGPDGAQAYVCRDFVCALPVSSPAALEAQLHA